MESRTVGERVVHLGLSSGFSIDPIEPQTASLINHGTRLSTAQVLVTPAVGSGKYKMPAWAVVMLVLVGLLAVGALGFAAVLVVKEKRGSPLFEPLLANENPLHHAGEREMSSSHNFPLSSSGSWPANHGGNPLTVVVGSSEKL